MEELSRSSKRNWRAEVKKPRTKAGSQKTVRPAVAKKLVFKEDAKGRAEPPSLDGVPPP